MLRKEEIVPSGKYRARRRKEISLDEQQEIVEQYLGKHWPMKEIALKHRITNNLVMNLVQEARKKPEKY